MAKYGQYCPVAKALDVFGDRWTLLIVRNMRCGMMHFNDLERGLPGISRMLLARRLRHLQQAGLIEKRSGTGRTSTEYHLTHAGRELHMVIGALIMWGEAWACGEPDPDELDAALLMWLMRSVAQSDRLPQELVVVVQFMFLGKQTATYWLILTKADVSLCVTDPGYGVDVVVTADLTTYYNLWYGRISYRDAIHEYGVTVEGLPRLVRAFPDWFAWRIADGVRAARTARNTRTVIEPHEGDPIHE